MTLASDRQSRMARAEQSLQGLSVGDAFGQQFFLPPGELLFRLEQRQAPRPTWEYTDDTVMAVSIVESLARRGTIDCDHLAGLFGSRYRLDPARGYGAGAHRILAEIAAGMPWKTVSTRVFGGQGSKGNGGAMRVAPLGAYFADDVDLTVENAERSAMVTHFHPEGRAGGVAVAVAAALLCREPAMESAEWLRQVAERLAEGETRRGIQRASELPADTPVEEVADMLGNGSEVLAQDTVPFSLWCAAHFRHDYQEALWNTVSALGDRDTTCAIVGGLVALTAPVPSPWLDAREPLPRW